jgi:hypothetical protein
MAKTYRNCPNCRQPVLVELEQLFDVGTDPTAKQKLLSGMSNVIQCPNCRYQGPIPTPVVYHDPEKELLLTYFPAEMGLPLNEQERLIGGLINQVVKNLSPEKRKAYLFQPQSMLTFQGMLERILEADGITREMIQAQQAKLNLLQRLLSASEEARKEIARSEDQLIDGDFFTLLGRLSESALATGDRKASQALADLQKALLSESTFGKQLQEQSREVEAAIASLQEAGEGLTREKLLELVVSAPNDTRLSALVNLIRPGMDYQFFQMLSERIDRARGDGRSRLIELRERLLELTRQVDQQLEARVVQIRQLLNKILEAEDVEDAIGQNISAVDELFMQELNAAMDAARKQGDLVKIGKLQKILSVIQEAMKAPPEIAFIEELLDVVDEKARSKMLDANREKITPELMDTLTNVVAQVQNSQDKELTTRLKEIHRQVLRYSMEMKLKG